MSQDAYQKKKDLTDGLENEHSNIAQHGEIF